MNTRKYNLIDEKIRLKVIKELNISKVQDNITVTKIFVETVNRYNDEKIKMIEVKARDFEKYSEDRYCDGGITIAVSTYFNNKYRLTLRYNNEDDRKIFVGIVIRKVKN